MGFLQELIIQVPRADTGTNQVTYQISNDFFSLFEGSLLEKANLVVKVYLDKTPGHIQLRFLIQGEVELSCDRTGELFDYPLHIERAVQFKLGQEYQELEVDLYVIERKTAYIELAQHIYDFINVAIPMKRLRPQFGEDLETEVGQ